MPRNSEGLDRYSSVMSPAPDEHSYAMGNKHENEQHIDPKLSLAIPQSRFVIKNQLLREALAELIGTMVMICFGDGVVAQVVLSDNAKGTYANINWCWGLAVTFGIYICGGVSGAHLNPAVTVSLAVFKKFEWYKVPAYVLAQVIGAFLGALWVFLIYYPAFNQMDPNRTMDYASIFATYPQDFESQASAFFTEVFGTALLLGVIIAVGDEQNQPCNMYTKPIAVGLLVVAIGMAFGYNTGYAINPARDFGPRALSACAGWGADVFTYRGGYFWVPIVGPLVGGVLGVAVYEFGIGMHHPVEEVDEYLP